MNDTPPQNWGNQYLEAHQHANNPHSPQEQYVQPAPPPPPVYGPQRPYKMDLANLAKAMAWMVFGVLLLCVLDRLV